MSKFSIKTLEIAGFASAVQALRLPFKKECRSKATSGMVVDDEGVFGYGINYASQVEFDEKYPLEKIGYLVGFSNYNSFYNQFKKYTGYSPSQYIRNNTKRDV